jgi:hypothetical protein
MQNPRPSLDQNVMDEINSAGGNLSKVARALGFDYHALKARHDNPRRYANAVVAPEPDDFRDLARPAVRRFAIAYKRAGRDWPERFDTIIDLARRAYDAGTHEMAQSTIDGWVVLYLIPRLVPTKPRAYFSTMEVM